MIAALAISLLVHLLLAAIFYWPRARPNPEEEIANVRILQLARRTPPPVAQTPLPRPSHAPVNAPKRKAIISTPHISSRRGPGPRSVQNAAPLPIATARPLPTASAAAIGCSKPNADAAVATKPDPPQLSAAERASFQSGTAVNAAIDVSLDPSGAVRDAKVARSSGNDALDATAIAMARAAAYSPKYVACKAVTATYTFTVRFVVW